LIAQKGWSLNVSKLFNPGLTV